MPEIAAPATDKQFFRATGCGIAADKRRANIEAGMQGLSSTLQDSPAEMGDTGKVAPLTLVVQPASMLV